MRVRIPRLVIAGLSGDSGKTTVSLSVLAALRARGLSVSVFKKGPDYIDAAWLSSVAGNACRNLDTYMVERERVARRFSAAAAGFDIALIEGNRGLFDGKDVHGTHSTAALARLLRAPVILVINATKTTRTVAALLNGCISFDPDIRIAGVILNKVAGERHRKTLIDSIEAYCDIPVVGCIPKLGADASIIPGRHLGLVPPSEFVSDDRLPEILARIASEHLDVDAMIAIAESSCEIDIDSVEEPRAAKADVRIGYFDDSVFTFYYAENLEALESSGAELVRISSLEDRALPEIDGLYIGGGFPETHAGRLSSNVSMLKSVRLASESGMPIYAECGGLIFLARSLAWDGETHEMAGVFPIDLQMSKRPAGHGYSRCEVDTPCPFFAKGTLIKGHEFHYSSLAGSLEGLATCCSVVEGVGLGSGRDGLLYKSTFAAYVHLHADGVPEWSWNFVSAARRFSGNHADDSVSGKTGERRIGDQSNGNISSLECTVGAGGLS